MLSSSILRGSVLDSAIADSGILTIVATRAGASAFLPDGREVKWPAKTLEKIHKSWEGGRVSANHDLFKEFGKIIDSGWDGESIFQTLFVNEELRKHIAANIDTVGVSIEADNPEIDDEGNIINAEGTGVSFIFFPGEAACPPDEGCKIMGNVPEELKKGLPEDLLEAAEGENLEDILAEVKFCGCVDCCDCDADCGDDCGCHVEAKMLEAAVLTTKKRKALPAGSFCGPDRSFPAQDAAHVRNGMARLGVWKGDGKSAIARCLARKAKNVGVEVSDAFKKKYGISGSVQDPTSTIKRGSSMSEEALDQLKDELASMKEEQEKLRAELLETVPPKKEEKAWEELTTDEKVNDLSRLTEQLKELKSQNEELRHFQETKLLEEKRVTLKELAQLGIEELTRYEKFDTTDIRMFIDDLKIVAQRVLANVETGSGAIVGQVILEDDKETMLAELKKRWNERLGWNPDVQ